MQQSLPMVYQIIASHTCLVISMCANPETTAKEQHRFMETHQCVRKSCRQIGAYSSALQLLGFKKHVEARPVDHRTSLLPFPCQVKLPCAGMDSGKCITTEKPTRGVLFVLKFRG